MTDKDIKPIPKYILEKIKRKDKQLCPEQKGHFRFYAYLAVWKKELVKVTVAVRNYHKKWYCIALYEIEQSNLCQLIIFL